MQLRIEEIDYLQEFTSICVSHAANRMAHFVPVPVYISHPSVNIVSAEYLETIKTSELWQHTIIIESEGDLSPFLILAFNDDMPHFILDNSPLVEGYYTGTDEFRKAYFQSMVIEMANIVSSAYMTATEQITGLFLIPKVPLALPQKNSIGFFLESLTDETAWNEGYVLLASSIFDATTSFNAFLYTIITLKDVRVILTAKETVKW